MVKQHLKERLKNKRNKEATVPLFSPTLPPKSFLLYSAHIPEPVYLRVQITRTSDSCVARDQITTDAVPPPFVPSIASGWLASVEKSQS